MTAAQVFGPVPPGHEVVVFVWSVEYGQCYECGLPAAFAAVGPDEHRKVEPHQLRCAVCAANAAANGDIIHRLDALTNCSGGEVTGNRLDPRQVQCRTCFAVMDSYSPTEDLVPTHRYGVPPTPVRSPAALYCPPRDL